MNTDLVYRVQPAQTVPRLEEGWDAPVWRQADTAQVTNFRPESSSHRPKTQVRLLHDRQGIYGIHQVQDQYVRSVRTRYMDEVWKDACVEVFLQPKAGAGYFNFEMNCGGSLVSNHIIDPTRSATGAIKDARPLPWTVAQAIQIRSTMPQVVEPEIAQPTVWELKFFIPFAVFEASLGCLGEVRGQQWRGNFFKCAEDNSHPHWASWAPVDEFNFHLPRCFGTLVFE